MIKAKPISQMTARAIEVNRGRPFRASAFKKLARGKIPFLAHWGKIKVSNFDKWCNDQKTKNIKSGVKFGLSIQRFIKMALRQAKRTP
jgi:hypothetical protein